MIVLLPLGRQRKSSVRCLKASIIAYIYIHVYMIMMDLNERVFLKVMSRLIR